MARKKKHEEHVNHERYLVTYSDLITLLLAFFIILYAMSNVDQKKMDDVANSMSLAFNSGNDKLIDLGMREKGNTRGTLTEEEKKMMKSIKEKKNFQNIQNSINSVVENKHLEGQIQTEITDKGLKVTLTDEILFESGNAKLKPENIDVIKTVGSLLVGISNPVQVSGYTDNVPIANANFESNWELSSTRAISVLKTILQTNPSLEPTRFSASGYGEYHPIADNNTIEGRKKNRRVEIMIQRVEEANALGKDNKKSESKS